MSANKSLVGIGCLGKFCRKFRLLCEGYVSQAVERNYRLTTITLRSRTPRLL